jgi:molybdopterin synthase catalytic subunit
MDRLTDHIEITDEPISLSAVSAFLRQSEGGAVNLFLGTTRKVTGDRITVELRYEAAPVLARAEIERIIARAREQWALLRVSIVHRIGIVPVGEASVVIGVAAAHRDESFRACRFLIDELKRRVPIWKKETFADGTKEWVEGTVPE